MSEIINSFSSVINTLNGVMYEPYVLPLILICAGIYFTFRTNFLQLRLFKESIKVVTEKPVNLGATSSFGALMVSTASRVGTGNIMGVSTALCLGGAGAIFWMWVTAIVGGASAFIESTLAQIYKKRDKDGSSYGGPSYYMQDALGQRWLGVIFSIVLILTYAVGYNMLASYNTQDTFSTFSFYNSSTPYMIGAVLAVLFGASVLGGARRLTKVTEVLVPLMGVIYVIVSLAVVIMNINLLPDVFAKIFKSAFDFKAIFGGFTGSCLMYGIKRGLYSNEAGMGSAPNAAAAADVSHPVKQGLVQMLSVFIDTLLICSATAFMCLFSGVEPSASAAGAAYVQSATQTALGEFGPVFVTVAVCLFAFTTLIGNYYYTEGCLRFIMKREPGKTFMMCYRLCATFLVFLGAVLSAGLAWDTADFLQALMVVINIPVIIILTKPALEALKDYEEQRKTKDNPLYHSTGNTDFWKE
ncbi:MAG: alanine:cation symporter family protein [Synergistaceae bacterium]|nr:alanine:cation symporter family protein [Synergistaceae bacterium]